jgi:hypothetical protein
MNKTVSSVIDDINEWENPRGGSVFYVTAIFTDETVGSAGRKDHDAALEVQGLLREAIGVEQDFTLEPKGQTKTGRDKFKILGFGTPGGAATYTAPGIQGGGNAPPVVVTHNPKGSRPPENVDASIRAAVALKAAASFLSMSAVGMEKVLEVAEFFEEWLQRKASEPALSAYESGGPPGSPLVSLSKPQAGVDSEESGGGGASDTSGEGTAESPPPHDFDPVAAAREYNTTDDEPSNVRGGGSPTSAAGRGRPPEHIHDWQLRQGVKGFLVCECGKTRKKETV